MDDETASILVIFGITGDLARRKLLPALYYLMKDKLLPEGFKIVGVTRQHLRVSDVFSHIEGLDGQLDHYVLRQLEQLTTVVTMNTTSIDDYRRLGVRLDDFEREAGKCLGRIFYLAVPAQTSSPVVRLLGEAGLLADCSLHNLRHSRLLVEKPFGYDGASAEELIALLHDYVTEQQIYRIDHYLAKETAQNILTFRFRNPLFRGMWSAEHIQSITITATEKIDIEGRAAFYEQTGALRDFIQSHLLQLLALTTMEEPVNQTSEAIHEKKLSLLESLHLASNSARRAQYAGYREEVGNPQSLTETYAEIQLSSTLPQWQNVPMILRTGKAMADKVTEVVITFHDPSCGDDTNALIIRIQPAEGIILDLLAKRPGFASALQKVEMDFHYHRTFAGKRNPDAYERVLIDALKGDQTLFASSSEVGASWRLLDPVLETWSKSSNITLYDKGTAIADMD